MSKKLSNRFASGIALAAAAAAALGAAHRASAATQYWRTDGASGTWTDPNWTTDPNPLSPTGGDAWAPDSDVRFTAASTANFTTTSVGNVTVDPGVNVTVTANGTLSLGGVVRTFDVGAGGLMTWQSQTVTATSAAGITKSGAGTLDLGALTWTTTMNGGFTLNAGTVICTGNKSQGNGVENFNGGTLQTSGSRNYTPTSIVIGGNFALAGTGNQNWDLATTISLGSTTRTITNNCASGSRQFRGIISGDPGVGLTFSGVASSNQLYVGSTANTFSGPLTLGGTNGAEVVFNGDGALGNTTQITIDGGRLTLGVMDTAGNTTALTSNTVSATRNIFVGASAGTSISISGATGVTSYAGVIADKPASTGAWAKQGSGKLILGGASTYTGATSLNNGIIQLSAGNNRLPTGTTLSVGQAASANLGTLDLNGFNQEIAGLNSTSGSNLTASNNTITSTSPATLTISGGGTYSYGDGTNANSGVITGAVAVVKTGSGTQTFGDTNTYTGGTTVQAGKLVVNRLHENNAVAISSGTLQVKDSSPTLPSFPSGDNAMVSRPGSMITIANDGGPMYSRVYSGTLDLGNNDLIVDYTGSSPFADVQDMVRSGFDFGDWFGKGITSSTAANPLSNGNYALGVAENGQLTNPFGADDPNDPNSLNPQFDNQVVDNTTVLVKFTHRVDLDLNGLVDGNDAAVFNGSFSEGDSGATWQTGDVDYDGVYSSNDAAIFNSFYDESLAHLPEPTSVGVLATLLPVLARNRRRRAPRRA